MPFSDPLSSFVNFCHTPCHHDILSRQLRRASTFQFRTSHKLPSECFHDIRRIRTNSHRLLYVINCLHKSLLSVVYNYRPIDDRLAAHSLAQRKSTCTCWCNRPRPTRGSSRPLHRCTRQVRRRQGTCVSRWGSRTLSIGCWQACTARRFCRFLPFWRIFRILTWWKPSDQGGARGTLEIFLGHCFSVTGA